jgi:hypothetical protein
VKLTNYEDKTIHEEYLICQGLTVKGCSKFAFLESPQKIKVFIFLYVVNVSRKRGESVLKKQFTILPQWKLKSDHHHIEAIVCHQVVSFA